MGYLSEKKRVVNALEPARGDGKLNYSDTDFAVQGNFGIMIEPDARTRIGLRYLSEAKLNFKDGLQLSNVGPIISRAKGHSLKLGVRMPQTVNVAVFHQLTDQWALLGDIGWEDWSRFGEIDAQVLPDGSSTAVDLVTRDVWHFGIGAQYQYTPRWLLSAGFSYDTSMSSDANRPIILLVGKMYRYGAGVEYNKQDDLTIGAGPDVVWEGNVPVKESGNNLAGTVQGKYENAYFVFGSVYASWKF
jgi:long-chain fatty acid transport protein